MKVKNKAQIALFIMIGMFILIAAGVYMYFVSMHFDKQDALSYVYMDVPSEFAPTVNFIDECLGVVGKEAIAYNRIQGGYYEVPKPYLKNGILRVPIYYTINSGNASWQKPEGQSDFFYPDIIVLEEELSDYVEAMFAGCTMNYNNFLSQGYMIDDSNPVVNSTILEGRVIFHLSYPINISLNNVSYFRNEFQTVVDSNYFSYYNYMHDYMERQREKPDFIRFSYLEDLTNEYGIVSDFNTTDQKTNIVAFYMFETENDFDENSNFLFAIDYYWPNEYP